MPDDFDLKTRQYRTSGGRIRSRAEMRGEIDKLTDHVKRNAKRLAESVHAGEITDAEFVNAMRELLKSGHIIAASVGRGGRDRMSASDWGRVGRKLRWQYKYLDKFARRIAADTISGIASANRSQLYASALHISYYDSVYIDYATGERPVDEDGNEILVRLIQNSAEGCEDCAADAGEGWMPVDLMAELGTRICGDYCKCDLEFSDVGIAEPIPIED